MQKQGFAESAKEEAQKITESVSGDPHKRLELRKAFYKECGHGSSIVPFGYGESEIAFLEWEIRRGVLDKTGSPWWKSVNSMFIFYSTWAWILSGKGRELIPGQELPVPVFLWLNYIKKPGSAAWYRAHNSSIISGYLNNKINALQENRFEQKFMNIVLYRVLFAQAMTEGAEFSELGKILADPELPAVQAITGLPEFYPEVYPLKESDYSEITGKGYNPVEAGVRFLDDILIHPELTDLYRNAAVWDMNPDVMKMINNGQPCYPECI